MKAVVTSLIALGVFLIASCGPVVDEELVAEWGKGAKDWQAKPSYVEPAKSRSSNSDESPSVDRSGVWEDWTTDGTSESNQTQTSNANEEDESEDLYEPRDTEVRDATDEW